MADKRQNRVARIIKLKEGEEFTGKFLGITIKDFVDTKYSTGEIRPLTSYIFAAKDGNRFMYRGDSGFKAAFDSALVQAGETITVKKMSKLELDDERSVNQYEIYEA